MQKNFILLVTVLLSNILYSQKITYNHIIDSTDATTLEIKKVFEGYLKSNPSNQQENNYWNTYVQKEFKQFDFLEDEFNPSLYMGFPAHVLSIKSNDNTHEIKVQYSYCQENGSPYVLAIANYYLKPINGDLKLFNALTLNREKWIKNKVGLIEYFYPKEYNFSHKKALEANEFIYQITDIFKTEPIEFEYYLAEDFDEIQKLKGFDYYIGMGGKTIPSGKASINRIFCAGLGENYKHEIVHVQIDKHYPNKHYWVTEGLATFLSGSSRGKSNDWHQRKIYNYLKKHPEINLNNLTEYVNFDNYTDYHYALGSFLISKIYEKGGWELIMKAMESGKTDEEFYYFLEQALGVKRKNLDNYLRGELENKFNS